MNDKRTLLRQPLSNYPQLSRDQLEARYTEVQEARDEDWRRWRDREKELLAGIPQKSAPAKRTEWDIFSERMGKLAPFIAPVIAVIYAWWDNTAYPPPGAKFWTGETVQPFFQSALLAAFTLMLYNRLLAALIVSLTGCLIFAYLFK